MLEEKKLHEKKRMEGRRLNEAEIEAENEEDWKATLHFDLEKEMKQIVEQFNQKKQSMRTIGHFARGLIALELKYQKAGLSWEEIRKMRRDIVNGKNGRTKTNINKTT